ncbi:hypothetical protein RRG08_046457 [Elysia crispata]|uniref:Uncharacterized protein n=1 Tax=Elysia crispata TaxID=231223 RepID=A0AAE0YIE3_9GAST|nr:hypothetical protein RRG08_046457 [Elysia crispata]
MDKISQGLHCPSCVLTSSKPSLERSRERTAQELWSPNQRKITVYWDQAEDNGLGSDEAVTTPSLPGKTHSYTPSYYKPSRRIESSISVRSRTIKRETGRAEDKHNSLL